MGKAWDYQVPSVETWIECLRVLKPGGHLITFGGSRTYHRMVVNVEDAGFEICDQLMWIYASGFPKSVNISKAISKISPKKSSDFEGLGTQLKPAHEPILLARKPLESTIASNVVKFKTGGLNIEKSRTKFSHVDNTRIGKQYSHNASPEFKSGVKKNNGEGEQISLYKESGRWPANVLHGGRDNVTHLFPNTKDGNASRFFYCAKVSRKERDFGLDGVQAINTASSKNVLVLNSTVNTSTGQLRNQNSSVKNNHTTVKPIALMSWLCNLITPEGGKILDPFMGSGSTGCAVVTNNFKFIGIEIDTHYYNIAKARIENSTKKCKKQFL